MYRSVEALLIKIYFILCRYVNKIGAGRENVSLKIFKGNIVAEGKMTRQVQDFREKSQSRFKQ